MHRTTIGSLFAITLAASAVVAAEERGKALYNAALPACHSADGAGTMPGVPDLTDKAGGLAKPDTLLLRSLLDGVQWPGAAVAMPPKGGNATLTEADMQAVLAYHPPEI
ncbi:MAG: c-type cytochrome [Burkholderiales bacterium]